MNVEKISLCAVEALFSISFDKYLLTQVMTSFSYSAMTNVQEKEGNKVYFFSWSLNLCVKIKNTENEHGSQK